MQGTETFIIIQAFEYTSSFVNLYFLLSWLLLLLFFPCGVIHSLKKLHKTMSYLIISKVFQTPSLWAYWSLNWWWLSTVTFFSIFTTVKKLLIYGGFLNAAYINSKKRKLWSENEGQTQNVPVKKKKKQDKTKFKSWSNKLHMFTTWAGDMIMVGVKAILCP